MDTSTLQLVPGSFVDETLRETISDLLFTVELMGESTLLYLLFEHQSTPDRTMPLRFLLSEARIWDAWQRENQKERLLPPILPLVLYHGDEPWDVPIRFSEMLRGNAASRQALSPYLPEFRFLLADLSGVTDAEIKARVVAGATFGAVALLLLKNIHAPDLRERLFGWSDLLRRVLAESTGLRALQTLLQYVYDAGGEEMSQADVNEVLSRANAGREAEETVMTLADKLRMEGREAGARESLLRLLRLRFRVLDSAALARIEGADLPLLERWLDRVLEARTVGDVFE
ncbi:MAG: Rpn family recombination-promoting nuclease/putative transposase [Planctomycetes bacterium]|nr:Rpn family recombination-promoting nuclease/putative transposase [Planctomycetota bacterium]